jgi:hypothetical protein
MAYQPTYETDDSAVPASVRIFFMRRLSELAGMLLILALIAAGLSLASWSVDDPSLNHALDAAASNWLGYPGAVIADELMQFFGLGVIVFLALPVRWAVGLLTHEGLSRPLTRLFSWLGAVLAASAALSAISTPSGWSLVSGLGGNAGDVLLSLVMMILGLALSASAAKLAGGLLMSGAFLLPGAAGPGPHRAQAVDKATAAPGHGRRIARATLGGLRSAGGYGANSGHAGANCAGPRPSSSAMAARMTSSAALRRNTMARGGAAAAMRHLPASNRFSRRVPGAPLPPPRHRMRRSHTTKKQATKPTSSPMPKMTRSSRSPHPASRASTSP